MNHWGKDFHSKKKNANFLLDKIHSVRREAIFRGNRSTITIKVRYCALWIHVSRPRYLIIKPVGLEPSNDEIPQNAFLARWSKTGEFANAIRTPNTCRNRLTIAQEVFRFLECELRDIFKMKFSEQIQFDAHLRQRINKFVSSFLMMKSRFHRFRKLII